MACQLPSRIVRDAMGWIDSLTSNDGPSHHAAVARGLVARSDGGTQSTAGKPERGAGATPFFLWLSFPEPHNPYQVPEPYFSLFPEEAVPERVAGPEALARKTGPLGEKWRWERHLIEASYPGYDAHWRRYRANYCGMLRLLDDQLRRFVGRLQARGLWENTILLF